METEHDQLEGAGTLVWHQLLVSTPMDIFSNIMSYPTGLDIICLWLCGDRFLNERLGPRGGVTRFRISTGSPKWPSIIMNFPHIQELMLINPGSISFINSIPDPFELPPQLRSLSLSFPGAERYIGQALAASSAQFQALSTLKLNSRLTKLHLQQVEPLKTLPSLTYLRLNYASFNGSLSDLLPSGLIEAYIYIELIDHLDFTLPAPLQRFYVNTGSFITCNEDVVFPTGLRAFTVYSRKYRASAQLIERLPRGLVDLTISSDESLERILKATPPFLTSLFLPNHHKTPSAEDIKLFPRSLTYVNCIEEVTLENVEFVPPLLSELSGVPNDPRILEKLPKGLLELSCLPRPSSVVFGDSSKPIALPKGLRNIVGLEADLLEYCILPDTLQGFYAAPGPFTDQHMRLLPRDLRTLHLQIDHLDHALAMPNRLTNLAISSDRPIWSPRAEDIKNLPRSLRLLSLAKIELESPQTLSHLPKYLQSLNLSLACLDNDGLSKLGNTLLSVLIVKVSRDQAGLGDAILSSMPPSLTTLEYYVPYPGYRDITVDAFKHLPRGLMSLAIPEAPKLLALTEKPSFWPPKLKNAVSQGRNINFEGPKPIEPRRPTVAPATL